MSMSMSMDLAVDNHNRNGDVWILTAISQYA